MTIIPMTLEEFYAYEKKKETCDTLNSFDKPGGGGREAKVAYAKSLSGDEQRWAFAWIRFQ